MHVSNRTARGATANSGTAARIAESYSMDLGTQLASLLGPTGWQTCDKGARQRDWLNQFGEEPLGVALPGSTAEVAEVVRLCRAAEVPLVPQGGNTSLAGGSVLGVRGGVILSLARMSAISEPDIESGTIEVEAGAILANLHQALEGTGFMFPMHLGSEGSAQIGGLIATNAGGSHAFRYGMMQDLVLGLEVVLPDGSVWNGMRRVQKDNTGYQLRKIFCGAEGTLGITTSAVLKLASEPMRQVTALVAAPDFRSVVRFGTQCRMRAGEFLTAMEFFSDFGMEMALTHIPSLVWPMEQRSPVYLLLEAGTTSGHVPIETILSELLEWGVEAGIVTDGVIASSEAQRSALWRLREEQPEGQRRAGQQLKHDISVPPGRLADFLTSAANECEAILEGVRINAFGHLGDGNVHFNLSPPIGYEGFSNLEKELTVRLSELADGMSGSFAAEHGLGRGKVSLADRLRDPVERRLMQGIKSMFDEAGHLNPGVIVSKHY